MRREWLAAFIGFARRINYVILDNSCGISGRISSGISGLKFDRSAALYQNVFSVCWNLDALAIDASISGKIKNSRSFHQKRHPAQPPPAGNRSGSRFGFGPGSTRFCCWPALLGPPRPPSPLPATPRNKQQRRISICPRHRFSKCPWPFTLAAVAAELLPATATANLTIAPSASAR